MKPKQIDWSKIVLLLNDERKPISRALREAGFHALTDEGAARRAVEIADGWIRFAGDSRRTYRYDEERGVWVPDMDAGFHIARKIKPVLRKEQARLLMLLDACQMSDYAKERVEHAYDHYYDSMESRSRLHSVADMFLKMEGVLCEEADFDNDVHALNCTNGWVDLRTGRLNPHSPEKMFTKSTGLVYAPKATCPRWDQHFEECFPHNPKVRDFLRRSAGASLSGYVGDRAFVFLYGRTAAGKSVILDTLAHVLGDYSVALSPAVLMRSRGNDNARDDARARLRGARLAVSDEVPGGVFDEATVKALASIGNITARFLRGHTFEFPPQFSLFIASNEKPIVDDSSGALWERMRFVEFKESFKERKEHGIEKVLKREAPGILAQLVKECREWYKSKHVIDVPPSIKKAGETYANNMDIIQQFMAEACEVKESGYITKGLAFAAFREYARRENQWRNFTARRFHNLMDAAGHHHSRKRDGNGKMRALGYHGFVLNDDFKEATRDYFKNRARGL